MRSIGDHTKITMKFSDLFQVRHDRQSPHAMSQYTAVTPEAIEQCQRDYRAGHDMSRSIPGLSAVKATVIAVESYPELAHELMPDLNQILVKALPTLPKRMPVRTEKEHPVKASVALSRNDPCWCGSGKKYKQCHMATDKQR